MIERTSGIYSYTDIARAKLCFGHRYQHQIPNTAIIVDNVSLNSDVEQYKFTVRSAALDIINRNLVIPAQQLQAVLKEMQSNRACRVPNTTASAIKFFCKNSAYPTGYCTMGELLLDLHAQGAAKEKKATEDRIKSLDTYKNEQICNIFLASFDASSDPEQWKLAKADILRIVYKTLVGWSEKL